MNKRGTRYSKQNPVYLSFGTLVDKWYDKSGAGGINEVFPINIDLINPTRQKKSKIEMDSRPRV